MIRTKRIYEPAASGDGYRVLVDRIWPRGVKKSDAVVDLWLKEIAPSTELRHWFDHDPEKWTEFGKRYQAELKPHTETLAMLRSKAQHGTVTLVNAARDTVHNNAVALAKMLNQGSGSHKASR
jgi:uncharacterized protein YeaO (DUF488 family)